MRQRWLPTVIVAAMAATLLAAAPAQAALPSYLTLEATHTSVANGWSKVERYRDSTPGFVQEQFPSDGRGDQTGQRRTFFDGTGQPHSSRFLLYYAPGWDTNPKATPVLLVHGANDNPDRAWANPGEAGGFGCGAVSCPSTGLMQHLAGAGYRVFAIGFAHPQGDNLLQAQQVGDAIQVIRSQLGVPAVDLVGWSKGMMSTRMYASSVRPSWGRPYAGDVRKLVSVGGPNAGYDYPFAHGWAHNFSIWPQCGAAVNAPSPHSHMTCFGQYLHRPESSFLPNPSCDCYPGQRQMLARFDSSYGIDATQQDWFTTYHGGPGFFTAGPGIQAAIDAGSLIVPIRQAGVPGSVETGTSLVGAANHLTLGWHSAARSQITAWLG